MSVLWWTMSGVRVVLRWGGRWLRLDRGLRKVYGEGSVEMLGLLEVLSGVVLLLEVKIVRDLVDVVGKAVRGRREWCWEGALGTVFVIVVVVNAPSTASSLL